VERAAAQSSSVEGGFAQALRDQPEIRDRIAEEDLADLLDPAGYLGAADAFVERALRAHEAREAQT
jgi:3-carboxy-cis,cis-muconate cycloisomerase